MITLKRIRLRKDVVMNIPADKTQKEASQSVEIKKSHGQNGVGSTFPFVDNRPETIAQRKLREGIKNGIPSPSVHAFPNGISDSPAVKQLKVFKGMAF